MGLGLNQKDKKRLKYKVWKNTSLKISIRYWRYKTYTQWEEYKTYKKHSSSELTAPDSVQVCRVTLTYSGTYMWTLQQDQCPGVGTDSSLEEGDLKRSRVWSCYSATAGFMSVVTHSTSFWHLIGPCGTVNRPLPEDTFNSGTGFTNIQSWVLLNRIRAEE